MRWKRGRGTLYSIIHWYRRRPLKIGRETSRPTRTRFHRRSISRVHWEPPSTAQEWLVVQANLSLPKAIGLVMNTLCPFSRVMEWWELKMVVVVVVVTSSCSRSIWSSWIRWVLRIPCTLRPRISRRCSSLGISLNNRLNSATINTGRPVLSRISGWALVATKSRRSWRRLIWRPWSLRNSRVWKISQTSSKGPLKAIPLKHPRRRELVPLFLRV